MRQLKLGTVWEMVRSGIGSYIKRRSTDHSEYYNHGFGKAYGTDGAMHFYQQSP